MAHFMDSMDAIGFRDLWRHRYPDGREFTWYSHRGNGFRITGRANVTIEGFTVTRADDKGIYVLSGSSQIRIP